jgi:hypothetical protein
MGLTHFAIWAAITAVTIGMAGDGDVVPLVLWLVISIVTYVASLHLHPRRTCRACDGTGRHTGLVFNYGHRMCLTCGGNGRRLRAGARMLNIPDTSPLGRWFGT